MSGQYDITQILRKTAHGSQKAYDRLMPLIYDKLKEIAGWHIKKEHREHTYSKTDLVHEAYLELIGLDNVNWKSRAHFYAIASRCMRNILIDYARKRKALKRGGNQKPVTYIDEIMNAERQADDLINLDHALDQLEELNERLSRVVECRYFGEMSLEDTAEALDVSVSTVQRDWIKARGWLYQHLKQRFSE